MTEAGNTYSATWFQVFSDTIPASRTAAEVRFIADHLPRPPFDRILDVACGRGRHAARLADAGYEVLGIDANPAAIASAREADSRATFAVHDMRRLRDLGSTFDGLLCLWQSFGVFSDQENAELLTAFRESVRPGGRVILDLYHREAAARLPAEEEFERGGVTITTRRSWQGARMRVELHYAAGDPVEAFEWRIYTIDEMRALAEAAGLRAREICAWWDATRRPSLDALRVQYVLERAGLDP